MKILLSLCLLICIAYAHKVELFLRSDLGNTRNQNCTKFDFDEYKATFVPTEEQLSPKDWVGKLRDAFSPDDTNPNSLRFVDMYEDGVLSVSGDTGVETWGRRFFPDGDCNPIFAATNESNKRTVDFACKLLNPDTPADVREQVENGALRFTVTMGTACGKKVLLFPSFYDGQGGDFTPAGGYQPPKAVDNLSLIHI